MIFGICCNTIHLKDGDIEDRKSASYASEGR